MSEGKQGLSIDTARGAGVEASLEPASTTARIAHLLHLDGVGAMVMLVLFRHLG